MKNALIIIHFVNELCTCLFNSGIKIMFVKFSINVTIDAF